MVHGVEVRIDTGCSFGENGRDHRSEGSQCTFVSEHTQHGHNRIRRPRDEPQPDDADHHSGQLDFSLVFVFTRLDAVRSDDNAKDRHVAVGDREEWHHPGEDEVQEHKHACIPGAIQIVETARRKETLRSVPAKAYVERGDRREDEGIDPAEYDHDHHLQSSGRSVRVQGIDNYVVSIDRNHRQGDDGHGSAVGAQQRVNGAPCE